jgi:hypothetical protein
MKPCVSCFILHNCQNYYLMKCIECEGGEPFLPPVQIPPAVASSPQIQHIRYNLTIYAPIIYTAPYVMVLMRASGRGLEPGNREFFGPCEMATSR